VRRLVAAGPKGMDQGGCQTTGHIGLLLKLLMYHIKIPAVIRGEEIIVQKG